MTTETENKLMPPTPRQAEVLETIKAKMAEYSPTVREIGMAMNIRSPNGVTGHLNALERKGLIRRTPGKARNIEVIA
jgi:repressor LexA